MSLTIAGNLTKEEWEKFVLSHPESSFLQSWYWGEFNEAIGKKIFRLAFRDSQKLIGICLAIIENAKRGRYLVVPGGPIINWQNQESVEIFFREIKKIARENNCVFVRIRPQLLETPENEKLFRDQGAQNSLVHLHAELTSVLDLAASEDELLAKMRKTTRYEIRKAVSQNIKVERSTDPQKIKRFYEIELETSKRHNFVPFSYEYLERQFAVFAKNNLAVLYEAYLEKTLLAQAFIIFYNQEAVYHYGTGTEEGRKYPGAYFIQWVAIKDAKKRGFRKYNFWGVAAIDNPLHRFYNVSVFKRGFGGQDFAYLHAQDLIINQPKYLLNYLVETVRKRVRKI